jgi:hypothetical protein
MFSKLHKVLEWDPISTISNLSVCVCTRVHAWAPTRVPKHLQNPNSEVVTPEEASFPSPGVLIHFVLL